MRSKYVNEKELLGMRRALSDDEWLPFAVALDTGLRIGDVAKIRWRDVQGSRVSYTAQKTGKQGVAYLAETTALEIWKRRRLAVSPWLFPSPSNPARHITRQALWKRLKTASKRSGMDSRGISPHSLRKAYGVREYRAHGLSAAQAGLQHTDIGTTEIYVLSDWLTGENADEPLRRSDMARIIRYIAEWLGIPLDGPQRKK